VVADVMSTQRLMVTDELMSKSIVSMNMTSTVLSSQTLDVRQEIHTPLIVVELCNATVQMTSPSVTAVSATMETLNAQTVVASTNISSPVIIAGKIVAKTIDTQDAPLRVSGRIETRSRHAYELMSYFDRCQAVDSALLSTLLCYRDGLVSIGEEYMRVWVNNTVNNNNTANNNNTDTNRALDAFLVPLNGTYRITLTPFKCLSADGTSIVTVTRDQVVVYEQRYQTSVTTPLCSNFATTYIWNGFQLGDVITFQVNEYVDNSFARYPASLIDTTITNRACKLTVELIA